MLHFTILFEYPYWIGLVERIEDGQLFAARHIFGAEPSSEEVYAFVQREFVGLLKQMTAGVPVEEVDSARRVNPKRWQRMIRRELDTQGITTRSQDALRAQLEQHRQTRQQTTREQREAERKHRRDRARDTRDKARARHRGH